MKRKVGKFIFIGVIVAFGLFLSLLVYLKITHTPILEGEVGYNISYNINQKLDVYHPTKKKYSKNPFIIYIHGGAWVVGRKESINFYRLNPSIDELRDQGFTIISPSYTLGQKDKPPFPECLNDIQDALNFVFTYSDSLQIDTTRFCLMGESAGAHLALLKSIDFIDQGKRPKCVIDIFGPTHLSCLYDQQKFILDTLYQYRKNLPKFISEPLDFTTYVFDFDLEKDTIQRDSFFIEHSPSLRVQKNFIPTLIIHGDADRLVPIYQSVDFKYRLDSLNIENELLIMPNTDHAFLGISDSTKINTQTKIVEFVLHNFEKNL